jgi:hypothetical protein
VNGGVKDKNKHKGRKRTKYFHKKLPPDFLNNAGLSSIDIKAIWKF